METVTITLDGVEVSGHAGMTILDLASESGVEIPTLCHDPHLAPTGACRLCLVENERSGALLASCVAPIAAGMAINTRSPRVMERRRVILRLMLASHPDSCLVCDKGNRCQLRQLASEMGIGLVGFQRIPRLDVIEEVNPFIERDLSKCVLCGKCIRADQDLVVEGAIDYIGRGFDSNPATVNDLPLEKSECTFCGTCVSLCPTGALSDKGRTYRGTTSTGVDTVCPFCGCGCGIRLEVKDSRIVRVRPASESPAGHGALCVRGSYGFDFVHSPDRLTSPLVRMDGELQETSWEDALDRVAGGFGQIREEHGADSLAVLGSSKCTNEENYLLQRFARGVLGTNNIDNGSRLYSAASRTGLGWSLGFPGTTGTLDDLEHSQVIMVIGADPTVSAPAVGYAVKRAVRHRNARLLLVDPRHARLVPFAEMWLRPKVGTDLALVNGLARVIAEEGLIDEEFVARRTDNYDEFVSSLGPYGPDAVETLTGVSGEDVRRAARLFASAERASIVYGNGVTQHVAGVDCVMALANLSMLTGNVERRGGGVFALQRDNNAQGACDMGSLPDFLPRYASVDDDQEKQSFEERWGGPVPTGTGLTALEMVEQAAAGSVKGMLVVGENPLNSFPSPSLVRKALTTLDVLVVADMFLTETAQLADVVLPAASFAEKRGTFTNFEGRVQQVRKAIEPIGGSLPDSEIVLQLASSMGHPMPYSSVQEVMSEIEELVPSYQRPGDSDPGTGDLDWAGPGSDRRGARRLFKGPFPSGFGRFSPATSPSPSTTAGDDYPLTLLAGSTLCHLGGGTRSMRASRLREFSPNAWVEISDRDAGQVGCSDGEEVKVVSPHGELAMTVRIADSLPAGIVFAPVSFPQSPVNDLFGMTLDPRTKAPALKSCPVRLERTGTDG